jgi:small neutral amino acid transporter SnatA (MarC family)
LGDVIFRDILKTNFASFQIFGGVIFLIIGVNFVFHGTSAIDALRGESSDVSGAIAMPILVGPGTISASVLIGQRLTIPQAVLAIVITVMFSVTVMIGLKSLHDYIQKKREVIVERYIEVAGRILALYIGTISIDMIMRGMQKWVKIIFDCL